MCASRPPSRAAGARPAHAAATPPAEPARRPRRPRRRPAGAPRAPRGRPPGRPPGRRRSAGPPGAPWHAGCCRVRDTVAHMMPCGECTPASGITPTSSYTPAMHQRPLMADISSFPKPCCDQQSSVTVCRVGCAPLRPDVRRQLGLRVQHIAGRVARHRAVVAGEELQRSESLSMLRTLPFSGLRLTSVAPAIHQALIAAATRLWHAISDWQAVVDTRWSRG